MEFLRHLPGIRTLRERGLLFPALVLVAVAAVLLQGALRREPPPAPPAVAEGPPAPPVPLFRQDLEKTPLTYQSDFWLQLARRASDDLVLVGGSRAPGVLIAPGLAVTSLAVADELVLADRQRQAEAEQAALALRPTTDTEGEPPPPSPPEAHAAAAPEPELVGVDVDHGLALFAVPGEHSSAFMAADAAALRPGAFVAAVTLAPDGSPRIMPGHLVSPAVGGRPGSEPFRVSIPFPDTLSVAAIIDLDGDLLGIAVEGADDVRVLSARTVLAIVGAIGTGGACQAIEVADLDERVLKLLGIGGGVLVERVVETAFGGTAPVQAGDVLLRWKDQNVETAEQFRQLYSDGEPGETVPFRLFRGRRAATGQLRMPSADCRPALEPVVHFAAVGLSVQWVERPDDAHARGWAVLAVRADTAAAGAGLEVGDLIVAVDGRTLAPATAREPFERFERRPQPMLLTVRREERIALLPLVPPDD